MTHTGVSNRLKKRIMVATVEVPCLSHRNPEVMTNISTRVLFLCLTLCNPKQSILFLNSAQMKCDHFAFSPSALCFMFIHTMQLICVCSIHCGYPQFTDSLVDGGWEHSCLGFLVHLPGHFCRVHSVEYTRRNRTIAGSWGVLPWN